MRIISKHKDYYDYYQGIFGMDNSKVYNRKEVYRLDEYVPDPINTNTDETVYEFYICGKQYTILEFRGKLYHTAKELEILDKLLLKVERIRHGRTYHHSGIQFKDWMNSQRVDKYEHQYKLTNGIDVDDNMKQREPVLINQKKPYSNSKNYMIPLLSDFNFHKVMDAKTLYIEIETFLGWLVDNPPLPDKQTNIGKITGHGFDTKRSFRPKMK